MKLSYSDLPFFASVSVFKASFMIKQHQLLDSITRETNGFPVLSVPLFKKSYTISVAIGHMKVYILQNCS